MQHAHTSHLATPETISDRLACRLEEHHAVIRDESDILARRKLIDSRHVPPKRSKKDIKGMSFDILLFGEIVRSKPSLLETLVSIDKEGLAHVETVANQIIESIGQVEAGNDAATVAAEMRKRVFTLFCRSYDEARRSAAYLRWHEGDAGDVVPSLWSFRADRSSPARKGRRRTISGDVPTDEDAMTERAPATRASGSDVAASPEGALAGADDTIESPTHLGGITKH